MSLRASDFSSEYNQAQTGYRGNSRLRSRVRRTYGNRDATATVTGRGRDSRRIVSSRASRQRTLSQRKSRGRGLYRTVKDFAATKRKPADTFTTSQERRYYRSRRYSMENQSSNADRMKGRNLNRKRVQLKRRFQDHSAFDTLINDAEE
mgnify:CR=1 FL=1